MKYICSECGETCILEEPDHEDYPKECPFGSMAKLVKQEQEDLWPNAECLQKA